jgi:hypothetical protein
MGCFSVLHISEFDSHLLFSCVFAQLFIRFWTRFHIPFYTCFHIHFHIRFWTRFLDSFFGLVSTSLSTPHSALVSASYFTLLDFSLETWVDFGPYFWLVDGMFSSLLFLSIRCSVLLWRVFLFMGDNWGWRGDVGSWLLHGMS